MVDLAAVTIPGLFAIAGTAFGSWATLRWERNSLRARKAEEAILMVSRVLGSLDDLLVHVSANAEKLELIDIKRLAAHPPGSKAELQSDVANALKAFPLPTPEEGFERSAGAKTFGVARGATEFLKQISRTNELADALKKDPTSNDLMSTFIARAQIAIGVDIILDAAGTVFRESSVIMGEIYGVKQNKKKLDQEEAKFKEDLRGYCDNTRNFSESVRKEAALLKLEFDKLH